MRIHKGRSAAYDVDKEHQYNWWKAAPGRKLNGPVKHLTRDELKAFAEQHGLAVSSQATCAAQRHS